MTNPIIQIEGDTLAALDAVAGDRVQLLVFSAAWCGPCKAMAPAIDDIATTYADTIGIAKIDIEASPDLARAFAVRGVPTLIMRRDGVTIDRHVGGLTRTRIGMMLDDALAAGGAAV